MEAVAEPVMDMQAILLGNKRNVEHKGTIYSLESQVFALPLFAVPSKAVEAATVHLTVILCG